MHALTECNLGCMLPLIHGCNSVRKDTPCINNRSASQLKLTEVLTIANLNPDNTSLLLNEARTGTIINNAGTQLGRCCTN